MSICVSWRRGRNRGKGASSPLVLALGSARQGLSPRQGAPPFMVIPRRGGSSSSRAVVVFFHSAEHKSNAESSCFPEQSRRFPTPQPGLKIGTANPPLPSRGHASLRLPFQAALGAARAGIRRGLGRRAIGQRQGAKRARLSLRSSPAMKGHKRGGGSTSSISDARVNKWGHSGLLRLFHRCLQQLCNPLAVTEPSMEHTKCPPPCSQMLPLTLSKVV